MVHKIALALHSDGSDLPADVAGYARAVTAIWAVIFVLLGTANLAWYLHPERTASWLPLAVDFAVIALFIVAEFLYRRRRYSTYTERSLGKFLNRLRHIDLRRIVIS